MDSLKSELRSAVDDPRLEAALALIDRLPWEARPSGEDYRMHLLRVARSVRCEFGLGLQATTHAPPCMGR